MAHGEIQVTVSVEEQIHEIARELALAIYKKHGVRLRSIDIDWMTHRIIGDSSPIATISILTET